MNTKIIIVGGFSEIIELAVDNGLIIAGIIDNQKTGDYFGYPILSNDQQALKLDIEFKSLPFLISIDQPSTRLKLYSFFKSNGFRFHTLISNKANISRTSKIGLGTIIQAGVNVSCEAKIGDFVKLNTRCNIMHNSIVGSFSTLAPNAVILGNVKIGDQCYIGANSTILPNVEIGINVTVGAGAVITKNIPDNKIIVGNPGEELR